MGEPKWKNGGAIFNPKNRNDFEYTAAHEDLGFAG
jgi:hypothetical protein